MIKIIFFGSDYHYSPTVLNSLKKDKRFQIIKTVTKKDQLNGLKSLTQADIGIVASFGSILPKEILDLPKHGLLNIHPSLLPKYRGPSPVKAALLADDQKTGVTIMKLVEKMDAGPILIQFEEPIQPDDTSESLLNRLFTQGVEELKKILPDYLEGKVDLKKQDDKKASYTKKYTREDGQIDWQKPDCYNERFIRAMQPWPGVWTEVKLQPDAKRRLKILKAHLEKGRLVLDRVQLEGKKPVTWKQFCEGYPEAKIITS